MVALTVFPLCRIKYFEHYPYTSHKIKNNNFMCFKCSENMSFRYLLVRIFSICYSVELCYYKRKFSKVSSIGLSVEIRPIYEETNT